MELEVHRHDAGWTRVCGLFHKPANLGTKPRKIICVAGWTLRRSGSEKSAPLYRH